MRLHSLTMKAYGRCTDVSLIVGEGVTVVLGANEAGKSTALDALSDLLWGIPLKTPRASEYQRPQLRVDAMLDVDGEVRTLVRKSTGLFADDLVTTVAPPWVRDGIDAVWWRTRLGIDHDELRRGGSEVFVGGGDIAELVFAAREGRSARAVLAEIEAKTDELFRTHKGAKNVKLRVAEAAYARAVADRDLRLTRAGNVVEQRELVAGLQRELDRAVEGVTATSEALKRAEEDARVIASVLRLRQARVEVAALDAEGYRLSSDELVEYSDASRSLADTEALVVQLTGEIAHLNRQIRELAVDDALLDDSATLERLQPLAAARIEVLKRADDEFSPAARHASGRLRALLEGIGIDAGGDLDAALASARIRVDHSATLDDLAERIERLEQKRGDAKEKRNEALDALLAKGVTVDFATSRPPSEEAIGALGADLRSARTGVVNCGTQLTDARTSTAAIRDGTPGARTDAATTHSDVLALRKQRDIRWSEVRRSWVSGELVDAGDRVDMAADLDGRILAADQIADDEAADRASIAAHDARIESHVEGLAAARSKEDAAADSLDAARDEVVRLEAVWAAAWSAFGIHEAPSLDAAPMVVALLVTAHAAHAKVLSAAGQIAELSGPWFEAAALAGLASASTTAAWRTQADVLQQVTILQGDRETAQESEALARKAWESFRSETIELLQRHAAHGAGRELTPAQVELGLSQLVRRLGEATSASATRKGYREQIDSKTIALNEAQLSAELASAALERLAEQNGVKGGGGLDELADRAERASDPLKHEATELGHLDTGVDPGSRVADVIGRLEGQGEVAVAQARDAAKARDDEARAAENVIREKHIAAKIDLNALETAAGAADAEAEVIARQAEVARLTEDWAILSLQRRLLEKVLAGYGSDDARPLLDRAGQILDRLTGGRWVALRAEEDVNARRLRVLRSDNDPKGTGELSEGTADQVFLALRLAAVAELHSERLASGELRLPLVLDDVLTAFDDDRTADALEILRDLAPGLQVIVFTHHQRVAEAAANLSGVVVSTLPAPAPIVGALAGEQVRAHAQDGAVAAEAKKVPVAHAGRDVDQAAVRKWAQEQGIEVGARGRVAPAVIEQYQRAHM